MGSPLSSYPLAWCLDAPESEFPRLDGRDIVLTPEQAAFARRRRVDEGASFRGLAAVALLLWPDLLPMALGRPASPDRLSTSPGTPFRPGRQRRGGTVGAMPPERVDRGAHAERRRADFWEWFEG